MEVVCLIENQKEDIRLEAEHGLSLFIDDGEKKILFDTGATGKILDNARLLNVKLEEVDLAFISHGHRDHGGGLESFFQVNPDAPVYMCQGAFEKHIRMDANFSKDISLDRHVLEEYGHRIHFLKESTRLRKNLYILTAICLKHDVPEGNRLLFKDSGSKLVPDTFNHELILVLKKKEGLVVFTGCSHQGILNILDTVVENFPDTPLLAVLGGLHLMVPPADDPKKLEILADSLLQYPLGKIYTGHCTGTQAYHYLKRIMGDGIEYLATGSRTKIQ
jgi:7,8-dihydropterin-6-yl-methyl-4-(beta-D-ribofuranosyl)aminobenzene 5'-phosphate synthase